MGSIPFELKGKTVYVAGHRGMVGGALVRRLAQEGVDRRTQGDLLHSRGGWHAPGRVRVGAEG